MTQAHVTSIDAIRRFAAAVVTFQQEARLCLATLDTQLRTILLWLERDRPTFWKREIESCMREMSGARVRLHQCRMRRLGDFRPSCIEEVKDLERAKQDIEFAQKQVPAVKRWHGEATHEANEYRGRAAQLAQTVERELPRLLALLMFTVDRLEAYAAIHTPDATPDHSFLTQLSNELQIMLAKLSPIEAALSAATDHGDTPSPPAEMTAGSTESTTPA
jgi:DNA repair ATPase RecN